jgi:hypothetical protein
MNRHHHLQRIRPSPRPCVTFRNTLSFYGGELLVPTTTTTTNKNKNKNNNNNNDDTFTFFVVSLEESYSLFSIPLLLIFIST